MKLPNDYARCDGEENERAGDNMDLLVRPECNGCISEGENDVFCESCKAPTFDMRMLKSEMLSNQRISNPAPTRN